MIGSRLTYDVLQFSSYEYQIDFLPKSKVEVAIEDSMLEKVIEVVKAATSTGEIGDGKIFVSELQEVVRIRTGESGAAAL